MKDNPNLKKDRLDLAYGNPAFLQEIFANSVALPVPYSNKMMPYAIGKQNLQSLEDEIIAIHKKQKNCKITKKSHIVVTVGAVQALQAALYAYRKIHYPTYLYSPAPYWGRFEEFAAAQNYKMTPWLLQEDDVEKQLTAVDKQPIGTIVKLLTTPNNPDGKLYTKHKAHIRDACYNWPHYTKKVTKLDDPVVIFSLSKLSGHSSTRIGWAVVQDEQITMYMREYVELYSSGVSVEAQHHAAMILHSINNPSNEVMESFFKIGRVKLGIRTAILEDLVKKYKLPIKVLSERGMFWYIECRPQVIFDLKIKCFHGSNSGDKKPDRYRLNIGVSTYDFEELCQRLENIGKSYKQWDV